ncbi:transglutaminase domain-containing protein [Fluviicola sp.]|uniref:transglutaminase domain-containing protein n=1 Tax=Fluviicola sp. TaxID=1917219 RepID=UPI0031D98D52
MIAKHQLVSLLVFILAGTGVFAQISDQRKFSLDSIVSSLDLSTRKDLEAAHRYLNACAQNDEEKVWLFYGYLGACFKYDKKRMGDMKAPFYNPELTAKKSKGVCRDFARVFEYLCTKSNIPCFAISGKTKMSVFEYIGRKFHRVSTQTNHQWNIVRVNGNWMLMDPTWTEISSKTKISVPDPQTKTMKSLNIISVDRTYYNPSPEFMAKTHAPIHPAFSLYSDVPTFKSIRKSPKKQLTYRENYRCNEVLDSIWKQQNTLFSRAFVDESFRYSNVPTLYSLFRYELDIALVKPESNHGVTLQFYDERISRIQNLVKHIHTVFGVDYTEQSRETIETLQKRRKALEKLHAKPKKK